MKPRTTLPNITDCPKESFLVGWWSGIAVGAITAIGFGVGLATAFVR